MTPTEFQIEGLTWTKLDARSGVQDMRGIWRRDDLADLKQLDDHLFEGVRELCTAGEQHMANREAQKARDCFGQAVVLLPPPRGRWNAAGWALLALAHVHVAVQDWKTARQILSDAMWSPGVFGNPWAHRLKGQVHYALGETERAVDDLTRAYMGAGRPVFEGAGPECLALVDEAVNSRDAASKNPEGPTRCNGGDGGHGGHGGGDGHQPCPSCQ